MTQHCTLLIATLISIFPVVVSGQAPDLGSAANFTFFTTKGTITNTGISVITGKIGTDDGDIAGFAPVPGQQEKANPVTTQAAADLQIACDQLDLAIPRLPAHVALLGGGETLTPGVYAVTQAASLQGTLNLDAQGNAGAVFIFKIQGSLTAGLSSQIMLLGGALACNVFWKVGGAVAIDIGCNMKGNFIAHPGAVSIAQDSRLEGRALSTAGAVDVEGAVALLPVNCSPVLPVELLSFSAECENETVVIRWITATELNNRNFVVERSAGGLNWQVVGTVEGAGSSTLTRTYSVKDHLSTEAISYYRLKQTDFDGNYKYREVVSVKNCKSSIEETVSVFPNPSAGKFNLLFTGDKTQVHFTEIYNAYGARIYESDAFETELNLSGKPPGVYLVRIHLPLKVINRRIIKE